MPAHSGVSGSIRFRPNQTTVDAITTLRKSFPGVLKDGDLLTLGKPLGLTTRGFMAFQSLPISAWMCVPNVPTPDYVIIYQSYGSLEAAFNDAARVMKNIQDVSGIIPMSYGERELLDISGVPRNGEGRDVEMVRRSTELISKNLKMLVSIASREDMVVQAEVAAFSGNHATRIVVENNKVAVEAGRVQWKLQWT